jgi:hypothetical protein
LIEDRCADGRDPILIDDESLEVRHHLPSNECQDL